MDTLYEELHVKSIPKSISIKTKEDIESRGETLFTGGSSSGHVRVFTLEDKHYIYVQRMGYNLLLEDNRPENYYLEIWTYVKTYAYIS